MSPATDSKDCAATAMTMKPSKWRRTIHRRYILAIMSFFGLFHTANLRVNLSCAIVAMTTNYSSLDDDAIVTHNEFDWNSKEQGIVLGAFFYGFITTQILGGIVAPLIGAARLLGLAIFASGVLTFMTPTVAYYGVVPLIIVRVLLGICQGVVYPAMQDLWSHWAPPMESTRLLSITYSGSSVGTFTAMAVSGIVARHLGWQWIFYIFGFTSFLWCLIWFSVVSESPSQDGHISVEELNYLSSTIEGKPKTKFLEVPWRCILTSMPIWAAVVAQMVATTSLYTILTHLPIFLNDVTSLQFDTLGMLAAVPYITNAVTSQLAGFLSDLLRDKYKIETTTVRKMFTCGSFIVQMSATILISFVDSAEAVIICLTIVVGTDGFATYTANFLDLAPEYAGLIMGFSNTIATTPGMIGPIIVGYVVQNKLATEWHAVFYITSTIALFGAIFYASFASGKRQSWASENQQETKL